MQASERKALAEQINGNPLFHEILSGIEADAIERLVNAKTELERIEAQTRVKAARAFRDELTMLVSKRDRKGAPA